MIIIAILLALIVFWIWSLVKSPSARARAIFDANGPAPESVSNRDRAFVTDLYRRFGMGDFAFQAIKHRPLDPEIAHQFGVKPASLDDVDQLGVRLPKLKLLVSFEPGRYRLTQEAKVMAERLKKTNESLENA